MRKNMGLTDRIVRVLLGAIVAILYVTGTISGTLAVVLGALAVIFIITGIVSFCPLYVPFGIKTCKS